MDKPSAEQAIRILDKLLLTTSPNQLAFWVTPNTILTLAGARAYCDGVYYGNTEQLKTWQEEINLSLKVLSSIIELSWSKTDISTSNSGEKYAGYELISKPGLDYVLAKTRLLGPIGRSINGGDIFKNMGEAIKPSLRLKKSEREHAAFGVLVGYPDKAILGAIASWRDDNRLANPLVAANIRGASYYFCPQPVYDYPRDLLGDEAINQHEQLWSRVLIDYYKSSFHRKLEADASFNKKIHELGLAEN